MVPFKPFQWTGNRSNKSIQIEQRIYNWIDGGVLKLNAVSGLWPSASQQNRDPTEIMNGTMKIYELSFTVL